MLPLYCPLSFQQTPGDDVLKRSFVVDGSLSVGECVKRVNGDVLRPRTSLGLLNVAMGTTVVSPMASADAATVASECSTLRDEPLNQ